MSAVRAGGDAGGVCLGGGGCDRRWRGAVAVRRRHRVGGRCLDAVPGVRARGHLAWVRCWRNCLPDNLNSSGSSDPPQPCAASSFEFRDRAAPQRRRELSYGQFKANACRNLGNVQQSDCARRKRRAGGGPRGKGERSCQCGRGGPPWGERDSVPRVWSVRRDFRPQSCLATPTSRGGV